MSKGNWVECYNLILTLPNWNRLVDEDHAAGIENLVKESCLKCFVFTYKETFCDLSFEFLSESFEIPICRVRAIVSKVSIYLILDDFQ